MVSVDHDAIKSTKTYLGRSREKKVTRLLLRRRMSTDRITNLPMSVLYSNSLNLLYRSWTLVTRVPSSQDIYHFMYNPLSEYSYVVANENQSQPGAEFDPPFAQTSVAY